MKVLVLAGGFDQIALIEEFKSRGYTVYLADYFADPPAKEYADKHFQVSTLDEEAVYQIAKEEKADLITTACTDQALLTVAVVSERLGLPCYLSSETARNVTNKAYMKRIFSEFEVPTAEWKVLEQESDLGNLLSHPLKYPLIVKPCDCNSSKGITKVKNDLDLRNAVIQAFQLSRSGKVIVEEYIEGEEVSIDVWRDCEGAKILAVSRTDKIKNQSENFTIYQSSYPVGISEKLVGEIQKTAEKICDAFELRNCPVLIQAILYADQLSVIEFSARMGGGSKYKLIEYMANIDIMKLYVNCVLGDISQIVTPKKSGKNIELNYVYADNGTFSKLCGFQTFLQSGKIKELFQYKKEGSIIEKKTTSSDRILGFLIEEDSLKKLKEVKREIIENVDILDNNGNSMMYKKCFYD